MTQMNTYKTAVAAKVIELINKGWQPEAAAKRARKACKHLHPATKKATARKMEAADQRFERTGSVNSYSQM